MSFTQGPSQGPGPNPGTSHHVAADGEVAPANGADGSMIEIYQANYSNTPLYESEVKGVIIMRRRKDNWLNATQILKVANLPKGRRTKILEKEITTGEHEKIQGGYGKFQGTWVPHATAVDVCRRYGVYDVMRTFLEYGMDPSTSHVVLSNTPTKEQVMARRRQQRYNAPQTSHTHSDAPDQTFFQNISSTASTAIHAIARAQRSHPKRSHSIEPEDHPEQARKKTRGNAMAETSLESQLAAYDPDQPIDTYSPANTGPPIDPRLLLVDQRYPDEHEIGNEDASSNQSDDDLYVETGLSLNQFLRALFAEPPDKIPETSRAFERLSAKQVNKPMGQYGNTALHMAGTHGYTDLAIQLIGQGADLDTVNVNGESVLMKAVENISCYAYSKFDVLLSVLNQTIPLRDSCGRTVLHHLARASGMKGRKGAARHYLEKIIEHVTRQGVSVPGRQRLNLSDFVLNVVDARDNDGTTALHIAAKIGNQQMVDQLIEVGANPDLPGKNGLSARDFGVMQRGAGAPMSSAVAEEPQWFDTYSRAEVFSRLEAIHREKMREKEGRVEGLRAAILALQIRKERDEERLRGATKLMMEQSIRRAKVEHFRRAVEELREMTEQKGIVGGELPAGMKAYVGLPEMVDSSSEDEGEEEDDEGEDGPAQDPRESSTSAIHDPEVRKCLGLLPSAELLRSRADTYAALAEEVAAEVDRLRRSGDAMKPLFQRIIQLCTGIEPGEMEGALEVLLPMLQYAMRDGNDMA